MARRRLLSRDEPALLLPPAFPKRDGEALVAEAPSGGLGVPSLEKSLARLGLERRPTPVEDVEAFVARVAAEKEAEADAEGADEGEG